MKNYRMKGKKSENVYIHLSKNLKKIFEKSSNKEIETMLKLQLFCDIVTLFSISSNKNAYKSSLYKLKTIRPNDL